jgi:hypothetical protein
MLCSSDQASDDAPIMINTWESLVEVCPDLSYSRQKIDIISLLTQSA